MTDVLFAAARGLPGDVRRRLIHRGGVDAGAMRNCTPLRKSGRAVRFEDDGCAVGRGQWSMRDQAGELPDLHSTPGPWPAPTAPCAGSARRTGEPGLAPAARHVGHAHTGEMRLSENDARARGGGGAVAYVRCVRPWQLTWGATPAEVVRPLPSDALVTDPTFDATRAITLEAPPEQVWPWLVQMGLTRAGWYSYDLLDNLGRPSARHIVPELQGLAAWRHRPDEPERQAGDEGPVRRRAHLDGVGRAREAPPGRGSSTKPSRAEPGSSPVSDRATGGSRRPSRSRCWSSSATSG